MKSLTRSFRSTFIALALVASSAAQALPISGLFNTGVNASGVGLGGLALGAADTHYDIASVATDPIVVSHVAYLPNNAASQWIWRHNASTIASETYSFTTTFSLAGLDPTTALINGSWGTDNEGLDILINGISTGQQLLGVVGANFSALHNFTISSGFVAGLNTIEFVIRNASGPGAFRAEMTGTASALQNVPEPATALLLGIGLLGLGAAKRKRGD